MTFQSYVTQQRQVNWRLAAVLVAVLNPLLPVQLSRSRWVGTVAQMFPFVQDARTSSAELSRAFYDEERKIHVPDSEPHPVFLSDRYQPDWLYEALEPAAVTFLDDDAGQEEMAHVIDIATKQVEQAGRDTIREAVEGGTNQKPDRKVKGWARVEGGGESCAFCTIMISRGPAYKFDTVGLDAASDEEAVEIWEQYNRSGDEDEFMKLMNRWHPNCDCKVVPVFDRKDWPGRDAYKEAEKLWTTFTKQPGKNSIKEFRKFLQAGKSGDLESPVAA